MDEILRIVGDMRLAEAHELAAATEQWQADFQGRAGYRLAGVILTSDWFCSRRVSSMGYAPARAQAINLRDQKQELEREVDERPGS